MLVLVYNQIDTEFCATNRINLQNSICPILCLGPVSLSCESAQKPLWTKLFNKASQPPF